MKNPLITKHFRFNNKNCNVFFVYVSAIATTALVFPVSAFDSCISGSSGSIVAKLEFLVQTQEACTQYLKLKNDLNHSSIPTELTFFATQSEEGLSLINLS